MHQAVIDLLVLEKLQGAITAGDTTKITLDPANEHFLFDPDLRTLSATQYRPNYEVNPVRLPW